MDNNNFRYDVFISYRHKPLDGAVAKKALAFIEGYKLPKELVGTAPQGPRRVFRDTEELSVSGILSDTIEKALNSAGILMVICSPDTPESEWVDREVATFIELGRARYIYALLIGGTEESSFPPSLKKVPDIAERLLDARAPTGSKVLDALPEALLPVLGRLAGQKPAEMQRAHKLRRYSQMTARYAAGAIVLVVAAGISLWLWTLAGQYRERALAEQQATMGLIDTLTYELPGRLIELPGTYGILSQNLAGNVENISAVLEVAEDPNAVSREKAINLEKLATTYNILGDSAAAVEASRQAVALLEPLYAADEAAYRADYAAALCNLGNRLSDAAEYDEAAGLLEQAVTLQRQAAGDANGDGARRDESLYLHNMAVNLTRMTRYREAIALEAESAAIVEPLVAAGDGALRASLIDIYRALATNHNYLGEYSAAADYLAEVCTLAEAMYEEHPGRSGLERLGAAYTSLAYNYNLLGDAGNAAFYYEQTIEAQQLLALDAENQAAQAALATTYGNYGASLNTFGNYAAARTYYEKARDIRAALAEGDNPLATALLARVYYNLAENALDAKDYAQAQADYDQCLALYGPVAEGLGTFHQAEYLARRAYYGVVFGGHLPDALADSRAAMALTPDSSFTGLIHAYTLMYNDLHDESLEMYQKMIDRGENEQQAIREDFAMLREKGLEHPTMAEVEALM